MQNSHGYKIGYLHLVERLRVGGAEVLLLHYIKSMGTQRYRHYVYCFGNDGPLRQKFECLGVPVKIAPSRASIKNPFKFVASILFLIKDILKFIKTNRIQFIQSHLGVANQLGVIAGKLSKIPAFPTIHNTMAFVDRRNLMDPRVHLIKILNAVIYRLADQVIAVSHEVKKITEREFHLPPGRVTVLQNGIVSDSLSVERAFLEKEFPDAADKLKIIGVGALTYQKFFSVLVRAAAELAERNFSEFFIMIVGEGVEEEPLARLIEELKLKNHVHLLGFRGDVISLLKASDLFVMPSRYEGLSIAMIEAMACNLPVIASNAPGLRDYVNENINGLPFEVGNHVELSEKILRLANDNALRKKLSQGAGETFAAHYNMDNNIISIENLILGRLGLKGQQQ